MEQKSNKYCIYADNAATTKPCAEAIKAAENTFTNFGNPSSMHKIGRDARKIVEEARKTVAKNINAKPSEIVFTSGGTESVNLAILTAAKMGENRGKKHIITTATEHHATLHMLDALKERGFEITVVPVSETGIVNHDNIEAAIRPDTILVTAMYVNNEVGTINLCDYIGEICDRHDVLYHIDATQAVGHIPLDVEDLRCDFLSASAHKFHGIKGSGFLFVNRPIKILPQILGGGQELGRRSGTENVPGIAAMAAAMDYVCEHLDENEDRLCDVADRIIYELTEQIPYCEFNGDVQARVPGIMNFSFKGVEGEAMLVMLEQAGIYASAGSACNSKEIEPSHVLTAMGVDKDMAKSAVRFSLDASITDEEVDYLIKTVKDIVARLRAFSPTYHE